jgi:AraC-like DNA-binding protein
VSHVLRSETGRTFWEHVHEARFARAVILLRDPALSIKEVAAAVGYRTSDLDRQFRLRAAMSPSQWRASDSLLVDRQVACRKGEVWQHGQTTNSTTRKRTTLEET